MRDHRAHLSRTALIALGAALIAVGFVPSALTTSAVAYTITAVFLGAANAIIHSSLQGWATEITPEARATTVSFFVFSLFLGASAITFITSDLAAAANYPLIFTIGAGLGIFLLATTPLVHARWQKKHQRSA